MLQQSNDRTTNSNQVWGSRQAEQALRQVATICGKALALKVLMAPDGTSFSADANELSAAGGIQSMQAKLDPGGVIQTSVKLVTLPKNSRCSQAFLANLIPEDGRIRLLPPVEEGEAFSFWQQIKLRAEPLSLTRANALQGQLHGMDALARTLAAEIPGIHSHADLAKLYQGMEEVLEPVEPWRPTGKSAIELRDWGGYVVDCLSGLLSVGLEAPDRATLSCGLASLADCVSGSGKSFGIFRKPAITAPGLLELAAKAPGYLVIPAHTLNLAVNPYDTHHAMRGLLASLEAQGRPVVFTGRMEELQALLSGGQGAVNDPLQPVVVHVPQLERKSVAEYCIGQAARFAGGLAIKTQQQLTGELLDALAGFPAGRQLQLLPVVAARLVAQLNDPDPAARQDARSYAVRLAGLEETFGGLADRPRVSGINRAREHYREKLTDPDLPAYLREPLVGQGPALDELTRRLAMEALTRPRQQPIRYCALGTPATGKSESARLLASWLKVPYVNIDAAGMPDHHTAASQLFGSGRGIVMSYQPGRLEQLAKHHAGVVVEISDLDHAPPSVRSYLADLFLQLMETGEAQSAVGATFSCDKILFAFTMNLPDGKDERLHGGIGFTRTASREDLSRAAGVEIKRMLSGAFLSRVGVPILFEPLGAGAMATILERAIMGAVRAAAQHQQITIERIELETGLGARLLQLHPTSTLAFGARALLEKARILTATAFLNARPDRSGAAVGTLIVELAADGGLTCRMD